MHGPNTASLLTPPGTAAIAVLRLTGSGVAGFLARHFSQATPPGRCVHGALADERGRVLDDPLVVVWPDGSLADISLHGGAWVVQSVLDLVGRAGFAREPIGTRRALLDATDELEREVIQREVIEREVIEHLPRARTELALRTLLAQPGAWAALRARAAPEVAREIPGIIADRSLTHLLHPPRVAIVGAPNVGKSTLANQLFGQERSITADVPGTTRDWVGEVANVDGLAVTLLDTPGVRETLDPLERAAIQRSGAEVGAADLVVLVLDVTRPIDPEQAPLRRAHPGALTVVNKVDRAAAWDVSADAPDALCTVASTGEGVDRLRDAIRAHFGCLAADGSRPLAWTERQRALLARAIRNPSTLHGV